MALVNKRLLYLYISKIAKMIPFFFSQKYKNIAKHAKKIVQTALIVGRFLKNLKITLEYAIL
jgi:hypothetical protein